MISESRYLQRGINFLNELFQIGIQQTLKLNILNIFSSGFEPLKATAKLLVQFALFNSITQKRLIFATFFCLLQFGT